MKNYRMQMKNYPMQTNKIEYRNVSHAIIKRCSNFIIILIFTKIWL